jgi:hypothetical protein
MRKKRILYAKTESCLNKEKVYINLLSGRVKENTFSYFRIPV